VKIHPTALIDPAARVGKNVEIGPYTVIGPQVSIGDGSVLGAHVVIEGEVKLGTRNVIGHGAIIGAAPQDLSFKAETRSAVHIGDDNVIREYCTIHRGTAEGSATTLGNQNFLMVGAHVGHNSAVADKVIIANNCLLGGYVEVADGAFLGGGCVFHQFIRIGRFAITQGGSAFSVDIPPFVIANDLNRVVGLNMVGLRRADFSPRERDEIKAAFKLIYSSGLNTTQALSRAAEKSWGQSAREFFDFIAAAKKRGICRYAGEKRAAEG
jgi:UDP-N-acetylglucosamine acyltransferase